MQLSILFSEFSSDKEQRQKMYYVHRDMKHRCYNIKNKRYHRYGGRGIKVCSRWLKSLDNFIKDMGYAPKGKQLDHINNDGNYEPKNCKWSTAKEQAINRRQKISTTKRKNNIKVLAFNSEMKLINTYKNVSEISNALNANRTMIYECLNGIIPFYKGYILKYETDYII